MEESKLSFLQLDALKEMGSIGSATAATALADMLSVKVEISVPNVSLVPLEKLATILASADALYFVLDVEILGDVGGRIFLLFSPNDAKFLAGSLLGRPIEEIDFEDEMFKSVVKEICNILFSAYVSALADLADFTILISPPTMTMDMVGAILDFIFIQIAEISEEALFIKTTLTVKGLNLEGVFLMFPTVESLQKIFNVFGVK